MSVHFSSQRLDWRTPKAVYDELDAEFHFDFDPFPPDYTENALLADWGQVNFCNPPYGRDLFLFLQKGYNEWKRGKTVVFLVPSRTDTAWWHDYCMQATEIRFIQGRLKFDDKKGEAPFPSAIVIFR